MTEFVQQKNIDNNGRLHEHFINWTRSGRLPPTPPDTTLVLPTLPLNGNGCVCIFSLNFHQCALGVFRIIYSVIHYVTIDWNRRRRFHFHCLAIPFGYSLWKSGRRTDKLNGSCEYISEKYPVSYRQSFMVCFLCAPQYLPLGLLLLLLACHVWSNFPSSSSIQVFQVRERASERPKRRLYFDGIFKMCISAFSASSGYTITHRPPTNSHRHDNDSAAQRTYRLYISAKKKATGKEEHNSNSNRSSDATS